MNNILTVLRFGWGYLRRYGVRLACGVLCGVVFALSNGSFIWATRTLSERFAGESATVSAPKVHASTSAGSDQLKAFNQSVQRTIDPWLPRMGQPLSWRQMTGLLLFLPLLVFVRSGAEYLNNYCMGWVSERVIRDMRLDVMEKLSTLSLDFFARSTTGDLLTRINVDTQNLLRALKQGMADLIKESFTVVAVFAGLLMLDWKLTLAVTVLLPACMLPLIILGKKARRAVAAGLRANISQSSQLVELLGGIRVIKAYNLEAEEMARFRKTSGQLVHAGMKGVQAKELVNPIIQIVGMIGLCALLLYFCSSCRSGNWRASTFCSNRRVSACTGSWKSWPNSRKSLTRPTRGRSRISNPRSPSRM
jgi:ABC-type multidrug transport system fused ATPase/permease subunit